MIRRFSPRAARIGALPAAVIRGLPARRPHSRSDSHVPTLSRR